MNGRTLFYEWLDKRMDRRYFMNGQTTYMNGQMSFYEWTDVLL